MDSSVLWAILKHETTGPAWMKKLVELRSAGPLVAREAIWAETRPPFANARQHGDTLARPGIIYDPLTAEAAALADELFARYRKAGGTRERLLPDFLIAAHALAQAKQLATLDAGFFRRHFHGIKIVNVSASAHET